MKLIKYIVQIAGLMAFHLSALSQEYGTLGVQLGQSKEYDMPAIIAFTPGSPAQAAGIPFSAYIWSINGKRVNTVEQAISAIRGHNYQLPIQIKTKNPGEFGFGNYSVMLTPPAAPLSRLELRAMQTRKFNKPSSDVFSAIIELAKDQNVKCNGSDITLEIVGLRSGAGEYVQVDSSLKEKKYVQKGFFKSIVAKPGFINCPGANIELSADPISKPDGGEFEYPDFSSLMKDAVSRPASLLEAPKSTNVRLRIIDNKGNQILNPEEYQKLFKEIADGLFVDAIKLTPAEMQ